LEDIDKFIKENHFDECGIIYCLSRMDCEKVAEKLQVGFPFSVFIVLQRFIICKSIGKLFIS
jgi:superfamily II DNA helicase RecQ